MRKFTAKILMSVVLAFCQSQPGLLFQTPAMAAEEIVAEAASDKEDAEILYQEAIELKKQNKLTEAADAYGRAIRIDRSVLALDDHGLIEILKKDCEEKLAKSPDDVKLLETLGFVFAVCYSDNKSAIECYEKVFNLVTDEKIKERTANLIERLRLTAQEQESYEAEISAQLRDERLKTWSEMERIEKFGEDSAMQQEKSARLADAYKSKDSLKNRVPQLENELKELQEEYEKANRLWYSLKDDLYERRRRRLKDDIAAKEEEVSKAKEELDAAETAASALEKELQDVQKQQDESPIKTYEENAPVEPADPSAGQSTEPPAAPPSNDFGSPDSGDQPEPETQEPLPAVDNPDFPGEDADDGNASEEGNAADEGKLEDLIDNL
ncbi:MAG: hypothetical protein PHV05_10595 [Candidatus Riflebacteria bacterium]|nr:hypothetical protein [Candidatus Riflebacteria bacterium]